MKNLSDIISSNPLVQATTSNKEKDANSLSSLVIRDMSQSDCIKLGLGVESVSADIIDDRTSLENIKPKNKKGKKERDHLFLDENNKTIYYAEFKANLNLDTEKSKSTYTKCIDIARELQLEYPGYQVQWCLVGCRYTSADTIPRVIQKKYDTIKSHLFGINEYFNLLGVDVYFTEEDYSKFINEIADAMFDEPV